MVNDFEKRMKYTLYNDVGGALSRPLYDTVLNKVVSAGTRLVFLKIDDRVRNVVKDVVHSSVANKCYEYEF
jgi:hypothetical protein